MIRANRIKLERKKTYLFVRNRCVTKISIMTKALVSNNSSIFFSFHENYDNNFAKEIHFPLEMIFPKVMLFTIIFPSLLFFSRLYFYG